MSGDFHLLTTVHDAAEPEGARFLGDPFWQDVVQTNADLWRERRMAEIQAGLDAILQAQPWWARLICRVLGMHGRIRRWAR